MALKRHIIYNKELKIYVLILNWNGKDNTLACLASLKKVKTAHEVVVVDNGSTDGSTNAISTSFPKTVLIQTKENLGYAEENNVGIRYALENKADFICLLNNDTIVEPDILEAFLKRDAPISLDYVCGVALFIHAEVFKKVGLFEPRYFLFWEDSDFCMRAKQANFPATVCPEAILYHKVSASFSVGKPHVTYFWWRNRLLWIDRNYTSDEKKVLMKKIRGDFFHALKLYLLKSLQLLFCKTTKKRRVRLRTYRAQLVGIKDYVIKRFGNGPAWIFEK